MPAEDRQSAKLEIGEDTQAEPMIGFKRAAIRRAWLG
jgi:hypothetical protein